MRATEPHPSAGARRKASAGECAICTSSWTTPPPTRPTPSPAFWTPTLDSTFTSRRPAPPGSARSRAGSRSSNDAPSIEASSPASKSCATRSAATFACTTITPPSLSPGPRPLMPSSRRSAGPENAEMVRELTARDTRAAEGCSAPGFDIAAGSLDRRLRRENDVAGRRGTRPCRGTEEARRFAMRSSADRRP